MSYTKFIQYQEDCNYINPEKDNAISMLKECINNKSTNNYKQSQFVINEEIYNPNSKVESVKKNLKMNQLDRELLYDLSKSYHEHTEENIQSTKKTIQPVKKTIQPIKKTIQTPKTNKKENGDLIEGFVSGDFLSDNGPGEQFIYTCPDEYELNNNNLCEKKCNNCNTKYDKNIHDNNQYNDICYPNNYEGIDNFGRIMCSSSSLDKKNNLLINQPIQLSHINSKEQLFSYFDVNTVVNLNNYNV